MKKTISTILLFCMALTLAGCGEEVPEATESSIYPLLLTAEGYEGPECYLMQEPSLGTFEDVYEVYARIDTSVEGWTDQAKAVISLVYSLYPQGERQVLCRVFKFTGDKPVRERTFENLLVVWESMRNELLSTSAPTLTWYPNGIGNGLTREKTEVWQPE